MSASPGPAEARTHTTHPINGPASTILEAVDVDVSFGGRTVLSGIDLRVHPGQRIALVGENGAGKSTLLRVLAGRLRPDRGTARRPHGTALQQQRPTWSSGTAVADVLAAATAAADALVEAVERAGEQLAARPGDHVAQRTLAEALEAAERAEAWTASARLAQQVEALGLASVAALPARPVAELSGGQRSRLHLLEVLAVAPAALLLDEPTNHLDDGAAAAVADLVRACPGPVVLASHDRHLIEQTATAVLDLDPGPDGPVLVPGGWEAYRRHHEQQRRSWADAYAAHRAAVDRARGEVHTRPTDVAHNRRPTDGDKFIHHFKGNRVQSVAGGRVRRARRRLGELEREEVRKPRQPLQLGVDQVTTGGPRGVLLSTDEASVAGRLRPTTLAIRPETRLLLTGPNGAGKSTLMSVLAGALDPDLGVVHRRPGLRLARLSQDATHLDPTRTPASIYEDATRDTVDAPPLVSLGLVAPRDAQRPLGALSHGQRRRLELAITIAAGPNLLLLDEPTDHLSLSLVEELEAALVRAPGAVVVATHDRWLRDRWDGEDLDLRPW